MADRHNHLQQILSPYPEDAGVWIHQNAWFHLGRFDKGFNTEYLLKAKGNGVYAFVLDGEIIVGDQLLHSRDGFGIWDTDRISIRAGSDAEILLMEVPMR
jgi:redox-sensitive bicupin YhaK (pirin superfamily)